MPAARRPGSSDGHRSECDHAVDGRTISRRRRPGLKELFTTGYTRNAIVHNGMLDAGVHLLGKPYSLDELAARVRQVLDETA